ncbi:MAG: LamG-like jellyroll fold domain-containing protein [Planctomycetota bacterium]|nr:LamG-like jellyroll fold domain-containing protein [Planctomycetota bacterium]
MFDPAILLLAALPGIVDCNGNGLDDAVEIAKGLAPDCQANGVIDDCERGGVEPLAYWRFEEFGGSTIADSGPLGLDGTTDDTAPISSIGPAEIPQTNAENLLARRIAGGGSVLVPDPTGALSLGGSSFTIEAWVRLDQLSNTNGPNQRQTLVQKKELAAGGATTDYLVLVQAGDASVTSDSNYGKTSDLTGREIAILFGSGSDTWIATSALQIRDNDWHHVSVSLDADTGKIRFTLDGRVSVVRPDRSDHVVNDGPLLIGAHTNAAGTFNQFLRGDVDEVRILDRVVPDELLLARYRGGDCNDNGIPDGCEIDAGDEDDCDGDGRPDACQVAENDCDGNGIPDQCDPDCNGNGVPDACDIALATSLDCQPDGFPDECQVAGDATIGYDETGVAYIAVRTDVPNMVWLQRFNANENGTIVSAIEADFGIVPPGIPYTAGIWNDPNGDGDPADAQVVWSAEGVTTDEEGFFTIPVPDIPVGDRGAVFYVGFAMVVDTDPSGGDFPASLDMFGDPTRGRAWLIGSIDPVDLDDLRTFSEEYGLVENRYMTGNWLIRAVTDAPALDCNDNGVPDDCDVLEGTSPDVDGDGRPDECGDCNGNGVLDGFEIADGFLGDCDGDAIPDVCQSFSNDCDGDGVPDSCAIDLGGDCNGNGILDPCDISSGYEIDEDGNGVPDSCDDCNGNGRIDFFDLELGTSDDCDGNGVPDECQFGDPVFDTIYTFADDEAESYLNLIGPTEFAWLTRHEVAAGAEWVGAIDISWGLAWPGQDAKVAVWSDPDGDGEPGDAELLAEVATFTTEVYSGASVRVPIPPTRIGDAGDFFFIGAWYTSPIGGSPIALDYDVDGTRSWLVFDADGGSVDLANLGGETLSEFSFYDFVIGAVAHDGTTFPGDCNLTTTLDACDILDGTSDDLDGDGVPDECEDDCPADFDGNGVVNGADVGLFFVQWGACPAACPADFNGDGVVNGVDLGTLLKSWGSCD